MSADPSPNVFAASATLERARQFEPDERSGGYPVDDWNLLLAAAETLSRGVQDSHHEAEQLRRELFARTFDALGTWPSATAPNDRTEVLELAGDLPTRHAFVGALFGSSIGAALVALVVWVLS